MGIADFGLRNGIEFRLRVGVLVGRRGVAWSGDGCFWGRNGRLSEGEVTLKGMIVASLIWLLVWWPQGFFELLGSELAWS